jgi:hypothetical protein
MVYAIMQQTAHIHEKVTSAIKLYDTYVINRDELIFLLGRYLTEGQIKELLGRLEV